MEKLRPIFRFVGRVLLAFGLFERVAVLLLGQRIAAVAGLTLKAAFRFRLVLVLAVTLLGGVVILPLIIKDDGTARGFTQILLTYTLTMITALLGCATLWLGCGTLARDVEECQIQMLAVKPVARWQIWLGKWLGILCLNALLLALSSGAVFLLLQWRAQRLPPAQQTILRNEVLVARGSAKEPVPDYEADVEHLMKAQLKENPALAADLPALQKIIRERVKASQQIVPPGYRRQWQIDLGLAKNYLRNQPLYIRAKFNVAQPSPSGTYPGRWVVGGFESPWAHRPEPLSLAADTFHQFAVPPNLFDESGQLTISFINLSDTALLFSLEEGMEVLYREGGFGLNFFRGVAIIFCWLALLAAMGLASASFLSFPVAAFLSLGILVVGFSSGTLSQIVTEGGIMGVNHETGYTENPTLLDQVAVPVARKILNVVNLVRGFSPIDSLSTGRSITWGLLARAFAQICLLMSGLFAAAGISIFTRRELATAQGNQ
ncbi:MAG: hypothetical protein AAB466_13305 [Verrucomicrobiota bacterium]